jgi:16S rRNA (uracil1498-N3)-methyltransferase
VRLSRVHLARTLAAGSEAVLDESASTHVARVLRLKAGAQLVLFDGSGADYAGRIVAITRDGVRIEVGARSDGLAESPLAVTLAQGVSRGERMDWTLQKATELGVRRIVPVIAARSVVRLDERQATAKHRHWRAIVTAACEQSGRSVLPELVSPLALATWLAQPRGNGPRLRLDPTAPGSLAEIDATPNSRTNLQNGSAAVELKEASTVGQKQVPAVVELNQSPTAVELLVGPEGGLDVEEIRAAETAGFVPVRLGPRVLRTETAGVVALAVLQARWGDLR